MGEALSTLTFLAAVFAVGTGVAFGLARITRGGGR